ncbi:hypothetical protein ACE6H2_006910 [Prunus campanulata]
MGLGLGLGLGRGCVEKRGDAGPRDFRVIERGDGSLSTSKTQVSNLPYVSDDAQISSSDLLARALLLVRARRRGLRENEVVGGEWWVRNEGGDVGREGGGRRRMGGGDAGFGFRV